MQDFIDNKTGKSFPQPAINGGYVFILFGPIFIYMGSTLIGLALLFVGLLVSFTVTGVRFDLKNGRFKEYTRYFMLKIGNWIPQKDYPFITIITDYESIGAFSFSKDSSELTNAVYGIYLLDKSKSHKILIKKYKDQDQAMLDLTGLASDIGVKVINL